MGCRRTAGIGKWGVAVCAALLSIHIAGVTGFFAVGGSRLTTRKSLFVAGSAQVAGTLKVGGICYLNGSTTDLAKSLSSLVNDATAYQLSATTQASQAAALLADVKKLSCEFDTHQMYLGRAQYYPLVIVGTTTLRRCTPDFAACYTLSTSLSFSAMGVVHPRTGLLYYFTAASPVQLKSISPYTVLGQTTIATLTGTTSGNLKFLMLDHLRATGDVFYWINTGNGLYRMSVADLNVNSLQSSALTACIDIPGGKMFFANNSGWYTFPLNSTSYAPTQLFSVNLASTIPSGCQVDSIAGYLFWRLSGAGTMYRVQLNTTYTATNLGVVSSGEFTLDRAGQRVIYCLSDMTCLTVMYNGGFPTVSLPAQTSVCKGIAWPDGLQFNLPCNATT